MLVKVGNIEAGMRRWVAALRLVGIGFFISGSILLGVVAGQWFDGKLNSQPFFVIAGLILGIIIAFYGVYRMVLPDIRNKKDRGNS